MDIFIRKLVKKINTVIIETIEKCIIEYNKCIMECATKCVGIMHGECQVFVHICLNSLSISTL